MKNTVLIRLFVPRPLVQRLDQIAAQVRAAVGHGVSRAAVIRALVFLHIDTLTPELTKIVASDTVKPGRPGRRPV